MAIEALQWGPLLGIHRSIREISQTLIKSGHRPEIATSLLFQRFFVLVAFLMMKPFQANSCPDALSRMVFLEMASQDIDSLSLFPCDIVLQELHGVRHLISDSASSGGVGAPPTEDVEVDFSCRFSICSMVEIKA